MCCLFGIYNYGNTPIKNLNVLTNALARQATARGKDATGIAYCNNGKLVIHKEAKSAFDINFKHPDSVVAVMGHTRHTTQGKECFNFNNHPFPGSCKNIKFALAHNGILSNEAQLRQKFNLPQTKIQTDSYIAVQLLNYKKELNTDNLKFMAEQVKGSFAFTVLDEKNTLNLIRGDNPLSLLHFPDKKLYVYASTDSILLKGLIDANFFDDIKTGRFEEINIKSGDILSISPDGTIKHNTFEYTDTSYLSYFNWWNYGAYSRYGYGKTYSDTYVEDLKSIAKGLGYEPDSIDELLSEGFTPEEVEEYIYCME